MRAGIAVISLAWLLLCAAACTREDRLRQDASPLIELRPRGDTCYVEVIQPGHDGTITLRLPELISDLDRRLIYSEANLDRGILWRREPDGTLHSSWSLEGVGKYRLTARPVADGILLDWEITNGGKDVWRYAAGTVCMDVHASPEFYDPSLKRIYLRRGGRWVTALESVKDARQTASNWFVPPGKEPCNLMRALLENPTPGAWMLSDFHPDEAIAAIRSRDGRSVLAQAWHEARYQIVNIGQGTQAGHACLDVCPFLGDIEPGRTVHLKSRIYLFQGDLDDLADKYQSALQSKSIDITRP